jgi:DNA-binding transcriptional MocR family regulator
MSGNSAIDWNFRLKRKRNLVSQIQSGIKKLITKGCLKPGHRVPSNKDLAAILGVSTKTIESAYKNLKATRMLESRGNVGTYVSRKPDRVYPAKTSQASFKYNKPLPVSYPRHLRVPFLKLGSNSARMVVAPITQNIRRFKIPQVLKDQVPGHEAVQAFENSVLEILSDRNILVEASQFCLANGLGRHLNLVVLSLLKQHAYVIISSPYDKMAMASFNLVNARMCFTGSDEEGMKTDTLEGFCLAHHVKALFIRPAEDYPTCASTSLARRVRIMELAVKYRFVIIEMYKEHEFLPADEPVSFWEMGHHDRVIYLGTVSRMHHVLNAMGIVVAPADFISQLEVNARGFSRYDHNSNQMLTKMVEDDTFRLISDLMVKADRTLRKNITILIKNYMRSQASFTISKAAYAVWIRLHRKIDPASILPELQRLELYDPEKQEEEHNGPVDAILLGFGGHEFAVIEKAMKLISSLCACNILIQLNSVLALCTV